MSLTHDLLNDLSRMRRKLSSMVQIGRITLAGNDSGNVQTHQVQMDGLSVRENTASIGMFGFSSLPPVNSDVVCLFLSGDRSNGLIIGTAHQASRLKGLTPGQAAVFDQAGSCVILNNDGTVTVTAATSIKFQTPLLECTGDIKDNCNAAGGRTMAQMRTFDQNHTHPVSGSTANASTTPE